MTDSKSKSFTKTIGIRTGSTYVMCLRPNWISLMLRPSCMFWIKRYEIVVEIDIT
jgi:hypothetical protein